MSLASLFRRNPLRNRAYTAYAVIVAQARDPAFFLDYEVPDTVDGRFELIALHMFLVLNRLKADHAATAEFAQELFDAMFADLDRGLREMGASDIGVGRHVRDMAEAFYGRIVAYEQGLTNGEQGLGEALRRNLYGTVKPTSESVTATAHYALVQAATLQGQSADFLLSGKINFSPLKVEK